MANRGESDEVGFQVRFQGTLEELQAQLRNVDERRREAVTRSNLYQQQLQAEQAAHAVARAALQEALAVIARGKAKHGDWERAPPESPIWYEWLAAHGNGRDGLELAYRMACKQNNMAVGLKSKWQLQYVSRDEGRRMPTVLDPAANFPIDQFFDWNRLLNNHPVIARRVAKYTMQQDSPIHFVSRLDPFGDYPPAEGDVDQISRLPMRFYWGRDRKVAINSAPRPSVVMAPMYVSRDFMEIFGTAFMSLNTFSFQSFGELCIFGRLMRRAWLQRITSIQIWWLGNNHQQLGLDDDDAGRRDKYDRRTWPLSCLTEFYRLKSLEIFLDETSKTAKRRSGEPDFVQWPLLASTKGQNNNRQFRDLRKIQGTDYIYQLRGIKNIKVYNIASEKYKDNAYDQSFVKDMRAQISRPKSRKIGRLSRFENLKPMLRRNRGPIYEASPQIDWITRSFFHHRLRWEAPDAPRVDGGYIDSSSESDSDFEHDQAPNQGDNAAGVLAPNASNPGVAGRRPGNPRSGSSATKDVPPRRGQANAAPDAARFLGRPPPGRISGFMDIASDDDSESDDDVVFVKSVPGVPIDLTKTPDIVYGQSIEDEQPVKQEIKSEGETVVQQTPVPPVGSRSPAPETHGDPDDDGSLARNLRPAVSGHADQSVMGQANVREEGVQELAPKIEVGVDGVDSIPGASESAIAITKKLMVSRTSVAGRTTPKADPIVYDLTGPDMPLFSTVVDLTSDDDRTGVGSTTAVQPAAFDPEGDVGGEDFVMQHVDDVGLSPKPRTTPERELDDDIFNSLDFGSPNPTPAGSGSNLQGDDAVFSGIRVSSPKCKNVDRDGAKDVDIADGASRSQDKSLFVSPEPGNDFDAVMGGYDGAGDERPSKRPKRGNGWAKISELRLALNAWRKIVPADD